MAVKYVFLSIFLMIPSRVQSDPLKEREQQEKDFIIPKSIANNVDLFVYKSEIDYIVSSNELGWEQAKYSCLTLSWSHAILAIVDTQDKIDFLSEALAETNKIFDNLWVAGRLMKDGNWSTGYFINGQIQHLPKDLIDKYNGTKNRVSHNIQRECLSFRRLNHDNASYVDLSCYVQRPYICQMAHDNTSSTNVTSSHPGWIRIGDRLYKIFYDKVSWANATINCFKVDSSAKLATVHDYATVRSLGRYLLVGRPSLENAWIGGKWSFEHNLYTFIHEGIMLSNVTDPQTNFPPWRGKVIKTGGCLLLDRHVEKTTLFVEARCQRLRPYVCHKPLTVAEGPGDNNTFLFPEGDFRLHYNKLRFEEAVATCTYPINGKPGILAQPKNINMTKELLFVMGENRAYVQHVWIGGKYLNNTWKWLKQKNNSSEPDEGGENIPDKNEQDYPPWVSNTTYTDDVENMNICLNMDRENHLDALFYGADCYYAQSFICQYPKGTLISNSKAITTENSSNTVVEEETTTTTTTTTEEEEEEKEVTNEEGNDEASEEATEEPQDDEPKVTKRPAKAQKKKKKTKYQSAAQ